MEELPADAYETPPLSPQAASTSAQDTAEIRGPHGIALYSFNAEGPGELTMCEGDRIELIERVDTSWLKGRLRGNEGIFPAEFLNVIEDLPVKTSQSKSGAPTKGHVSTAVYDFDGQEEEGELSFKAGDKITLLSRVNTEWVNGELRGKKGMFPCDFVGSIPDNLPAAGVEEKKEDTGKSKPKDEGGTGKCEALFDFEGDEGAGELSFVTGTMITSLERVDDDWMRGQIGTKEGIFPVSFIKIITMIAKAPQIKKLKETSSTTGPFSKTKTNMQNLTDDLMPKAVALSSYNAKDSNEISFEEGDVLYLLSKEGSDRFMGERVKTGDLGEFPAKCINVVVPLP